MAGGAGQPIPNAGRRAPGAGRLTPRRKGGRGQGGAPLDTMSGARKNVVEGLPAENACHKMLARTSFDIVLPQAGLNRPHPYPV